MNLYHIHSTLLLKAAIIFLILCSLVLNACGGVTVTPTQISSSTPAPSSTATISPPHAVVSFEVVIPTANNQNQNITIEILDEVTGLGLNPTRYQMKAIDSTHYGIQLPFVPGSVIKYRYIQESATSAVEHNSKGEQVRYRLFYVTGPDHIKDIVTTWGTQPYNGMKGRISGTIVDAKSGSALANIMVAAGGTVTLSNGDGSYHLDGLTPGIHNLVAYALDGSYTSFQQGANVEPDLNTPAPIELAQAHLVNITFKVSVPPDVAVGVPLRMAGNLLQLGNTFADLRGGTNSIASRMPLMTLQADGKYNLTMHLPVGADLEYKYTLGDGFWNAEQNKDGMFELRQLIVPAVDTIIEDTVATWKVGNSAPITFEVTSPVNTPATDIISIQFNPFAWMEPVPMWSLGNNHWLYILFSPLNVVNSFNYRYCRNDQCGSADDASTAGPNPPGWPVKVGHMPQTFKDDIKQWAWWNPSQTPTTIPAADIKTRANTFLAGLELSPAYHPSWQPYTLPVLQEFSKIGANWVVFSPSWTVSNDVAAPDFRLIAGNNPLWPDLISNVFESRALGLNVALFPQPVFFESSNKWWQTAVKDTQWWQKWFEQYREFILYHADLAAHSGANALILGGDWLIPALPDGVLGDGRPSGVPADAQIRWQNLIDEVKGHFNGQIIWAIPYTPSFTNFPVLLNSVDQIYVLFSTPILNTIPYTQQDLDTSFTTIFDTDILRLYAQFKKPIIIGLGFPSIVYSASTCLSFDSGGCENPSPLDQPVAEGIQNYPVDLQAQVDIFNVIFSVVNQRDWINGIISRGFNPSAKLQDSSRSIYGKPAFDVVWYWFSRMVKP